MATSHLIGALLALTSAIAWGTGDFFGGVATRRRDQFQVLALSTLSGLGILIVLTLVRSESFPSIKGTIWAYSAGASGALGIAILYYGLSLGNAAIIAPTTSVIGTALPVIFSIFTRGLPGLPQRLGFILAIVGIWLVSQSPTGSRRVSNQGLLLAFLAGLGFGGFFILIAQVDSSDVFATLVVAKSGALSVAMLLLLIRRRALPTPVSNPIALLAGALDAGGNIFFLLAKQFTRLDVAVVLSSMYASTTVILTSIILKEVLSASQWMGLVLCMIAIALIVI